MKERGGNATRELQRKRHRLIHDHKYSLGKACRTRVTNAGRAEARHGLKPLLVGSKIRLMNNLETEKSGKHVEFCESVIEYPVGRRPQGTSGRSFATAHL